ncbi:hypothetical protein Mapa_009318 [Marchantia paleacea]|nr:hypothetical protein Mapa_009318 [Marchantia paleacea]
MLLNNDRSELFVPVSGVDKMCMSLQKVLGRVEGSIKFMRVKVCILPYLSQFSQHLGFLM